MRFLLGLVGHMGSGKTTVANYLVEKYRFRHLRIAGKMRQIAEELELVPTREFLQGIGKFMRKFDDDVWVRYLSKQIQNSTQSIIVDDIRRINEVEYLKPLGFTFIRIDAPEKIRRLRLQQRDNLIILDEDWKIWSEHLTEVQVPLIPVDEIIYNSGVVSKLYKEIDEYLSKKKNS